MESARIGEQREAEPRKGRPPLGVYCGGAVCAARRGAVAAWERSGAERRGDDRWMRGPGGRLRGADSRQPTPRIEESRSGRSFGGPRLTVTEFWPLAVFRACLVPENFWETLL
jgi:hypothetical protein